ncbi:MAG: hypothetical protein PHI53_00905 [Candidatus Pacebacteria bacterium]|nr:hypothetical protein [Candidatus Paceibacterota bacterium]
MRNILLVSLIIIGLAALFLPNFYISSNNIFKSSYSYLGSLKAQVGDTLIGFWSNEKPKLEQEFNKEVLEIKLESLKIKEYISNIY